MGSTLPKDKCQQKRMIISTIDLTSEWTTTPKKAMLRYQLDPWTKKELKRRGEQVVPSWAMLSPTLCLTSMTDSEVLIKILWIGHRRRALKWNLTEFLAVCSSLIDLKLPIPSVSPRDENPHRRIWLFLAFPDLFTKDKGPWVLGFISVNQSFLWLVPMPTWSNSLANDASHNVRLK